MATFAELNKYYLAYFGRPVDYAGSREWADKTTAQVEAAFAASNESKALYASSSKYDFVNNVYKNVIGRPAELAGLNYWVDQIDSGKITQAGAAIAILNDALLTADKTSVQNKLEAGEGFFNAIDTTAEVLAYQGDAAAASARAFIAGVTATPATAEQVTAALAAVGEASAGATGQTFTLTQGLDTIAGTSGNDTINAYAFNSVTGADTTTLQSVDTINGGAGTDTLNIEVKDADGAGVGVVDLNDTIQGTISNIEIVNINNAAAASAAAVDATTLGTAAQQIWQIGKAANVTKLAATTTAGLKNITVGSQTISAADDATKASVAFDTVDEGLTFAINSTTAAGVLNTVSVAGTVKDLNADGITNTNINVTAGKDVQSVVVNTGVTTTLTVANAAGSTKAVNAVDLSGSTGGVTYTTAANTVASINGGAGNDTLTNIFAGTATANAATLNGGAGNDTLNVNVTKGAATAVTATVDGGDGNDTINLTTNADVKYVVTGGAGDDTVAITAGTSGIKTTDSIDGGDGTDTVSVAGAAARIADDYIILNKVLKNFEALKFSSAEGTGTALDASQLAANYATLDFFTGSVVDNVGTQALISRGALTAEAAGYKSAAESLAAGGANAIVYAGTVNITDKGLAAAADAIQVRADTVNLTVEGGKANGVLANNAVLSGEAKSATVILSAGTDTKGTAVTTDDTLVASSVTVKQDAAAAANNLKDLASLTLTGNGAATVEIGDVTTPTTAAHKLVLVDASGLNSVNEKGEAVTGLTYKSVNTAAETVKLGGGIDSVTLGASTYGKMDTVEGLNLVVSGGALTAASDTITITGNVGLAAAGKMTTTQTDLDLALLDAAKFKAAGVDVDTVVFQLGGNTYFYQDTNGDELVDVADTVVKFTGLIDLDALVIAL